MTPGSFASTRETSFRAASLRSTPIRRSRPWSTAAARRRSASSNSGAILVYLAEKFGAFLSTDLAPRAECLSWLFWQIGAAPYLGGGFGHFYAYAPEKIEYAIDRFAMEVKRQLDVLDKRLAETQFLAGDAYTIADMAVWPWYGALVEGKLYDAGEFLQVEAYTNVRRWSEALGKRPAVRRGRMVNRTFGDPAEQLPERHDASDFEASLTSTNL